MSDYLTTPGHRWKRKRDGAMFWIVRGPFGSHEWIKLRSGNERIHEVSTSGLLSKYQYDGFGGVDLPAQEDNK